MPYSGVPKGSDTEKKIERCVQRVMGQNPGWSKSRAIATCRASIEKKEAAMPKTKNGMTARQRRQIDRRKEEEMLKRVNGGIPLEELYDDPVLEAPESLKDLVSDYSEEEVEEKGYYGDEVTAMPGPTSFDEMDQAREENEKAHKLRMVAYDAEDIVYNIIRTPNLSPDEKASKIAKVGTDMASRAKKALGKEKESKSFDYDLAHTEILLSMTDKSIGTKLADWLQKAMLTNGKQKALEDSDFALVVERDGETMRKYPVVDKAQVRNSLATAAQMIRNGGEDAEDARAALPELRKAAKEFGIGQPSETNQNAIIVHKDKDNKYRYVGWLSGKWIDRDTDILSDESHREFKEFLDNNPDWQIVFRSWHVPGSERTYPVDFWTYQDGFVIVSGPLEEKEAEGLMTAMQKQRLGMSHGFFAVRDAQDTRIIRKYRTFEVSDLPLDNAAFAWSDLSTLMEEKSMNTKLEYLKTSIGEEKLNKILQDTEIKKSFLENIGVEEKDFDAFMAGEEIPEQEPEKKDKGATPELSEEVVSLMKSALGLQDFDPAEIKKSLEQASASAAILPAVLKQLETLSEELKESKKDASEQLADLLTGANGKRQEVVKARASQSEDNLVDEDDETYKNALPKHESTWLTDLAGIAPVTGGK